jgi:quinoprotein glucose dehydrogenase
MLKIRFVSALARAFFVGFLAGWMGSAASTGRAQDSKEFRPRVAPASSEAQLAIKTFKIPQGLKVDLWAAEPLLANPVAIATDAQGRWYVCETFRHTDGVLDIRGIMPWLDEELASKSVEERIAIMRRHLTDEQIQSYTRESERIRLLTDQDGDGRADHATVFAEGFNHLEDGIGAGVLVRDGDVYYTCIPDLWLLRDEDGDGKAEIKESLQHGYGIRVGYLGHDLHGLRMGPDGKIYFSIGDRGLNVKQGGHRVTSFECGAVLRCNRDGSELEIVHRGLRNPQELAFDQFGDLFAGDNNSDGGDKARFVYVVEGGDSGWRIGFQFITRPNSRGPWIAERMDEPLTDPNLQPAFLVPPVADIGSGPSGLTHDPGTGLPEAYRDHFFLCDFRGSRSASGIHCFKVEPNGATFRVAKLRPFLWNILATDTDFGVDGGLYVSDWVEGWNKPGKGRIYRVHDPAEDADPLVRQTETLLREGMAKRSNSERAHWLAHPDQRVRLEAQFALADEGPAAISNLREVAAKSTNQLARLHAIWGLGQISSASKDPGPKGTALEPLLALLDDADGEVRAQAARVLGNERFAPAYDRLVALTKDSNSRVQFFAAMGLGKLGRSSAWPAVIDLIRSNADRDPYLRHAGVMALTRLKKPAALEAAAQDSSPAVRMAALLTMRRLGQPEVGRFLTDPEPRLVLEAARAVNDLPLKEALPQLAAILSKGGPVPLLRRAVNANFRVGKKPQAQALVAFALVTNAPAAIRAEAIERVGDWVQPPGRDAVTGLWRPLPKRSGAVATAALSDHLSSLLNGPADVQVAAIRAVEKLGMHQTGPALLAKVKAAGEDGRVRVAALRTLAALKDPGLAAAINLGLVSPDRSLRREATRWQAQSNPTEAVRQLETSLAKGSIPEKQAALAILGATPGAEVDRLLSSWLDKLLAGGVPPALRLDILEAAGQRHATNITEMVQRYEASRKGDDPLRGYRECLEGGNATEGRMIFFERVDVSCVRCHKINGEGGDAGPNLSQVGARQNREYIMESILYPNQKIAPGFETVLVFLKSGAGYAGVLTKETETTLEINSPEDGPITISKADIKSREKGLSGMPAELRQILSKRDVRNLVEFLSGLK